MRIETSQSARKQRIGIYIYIRRNPVDRVGLDKALMGEHLDLKFLKTIPMRGKFSVLCPCLRRKFVDWDVPAAIGSLLSTAYWVSPERR